MGGAPAVWARATSCGVPPKQRPPSKQPFSIPVHTPGPPRGGQRDSVQLGGGVRVLGVGRGGGDNPSWPARSTRALHPIPGRRGVACRACVAQARPAALPLAGAWPLCRRIRTRASAVRPNPRARRPPRAPPHADAIASCSRRRRPGHPRRHHHPPPTPPPYHCALLSTFPRGPTPAASRPCSCHDLSRRIHCAPPPPSHHGGLCRGRGVCADGGLPAGGRAERPPVDRLDGGARAGGSSGRVGHLDEGAE